MVVKATKQATKDANKSLIVVDHELGLGDGVADHIDGGEDLLAFAIVDVEVAEIHVVPAEGSAADEVAVVIGVVGVAGAEGLAGAGDVEAAELDGGGTEDGLGGDADGAHLHVANGGLEVALGMRRDGGAIPFCCHRSSR